MTMINMFRMFLIFFIAHLVMGFFIFKMMFVMMLSVFSAFWSMLSSSFMNFMYQIKLCTSKMWFITAVFKISKGCRLPIVCISVLMLIFYYTAFGMTIMMMMMTNTVKGSNFLNSGFTLSIIVFLSFFKCNCKNLLTLFLVCKQNFILIYFIRKKSLYTCKEHENNWFQHFFNFLINKYKTF